MTFLLETVVFKLLDLGEDEEREANKLFVSLCERKQALSPVDRDSLILILREYKSRVFDWLPEEDSGERKRGDRFRHPLPGV